MRCGPDFKVDRLPDTANRAIPALFSMGDFGEIRGAGAVGQVTLDAKKVGVLQQIGRNSADEGQVAAFVGADVVPVQKNRRQIADCAKPQLGDVARRNGGARKAAFIGGVAGTLAKIGKLRLPGKGNLRVAPRAILVLKAPLSIKADLEGRGHGWLLLPGDRWGAKGLNGG